MNIYETTSPESKFPNEYSDVILFKSIYIWKSYCKNTKGSQFYESQRSYADGIDQQDFYWSFGTEDLFNVFGLRTITVVQWSSI